MWGKGKKIEGRKESQPCNLQFSVFLRPEVDRPRIKVGIFDESYKYVPKKKKVGFSLTLVPLNLRVINGRVV